MVLSINSRVNTGPTDGQRQTGFWDWHTSGRLYSDKKKSSFSRHFYWDSMAA